MWGISIAPPPPPSGFRLGHQTSASEGSILSLYSEKRRGIMKRPVFEAEKDQGEGSRSRPPVDRAFTGVVLVVDLNKK